jgi:flagellar M-ring protein FliF
VQGQMRASSLQRLSRLAEAHPEETLTVLRRWLSPQE